MTPDIAEMRAILAQIKAHPETWDQESWAMRSACGTTYCFAGWAVARAGIKLDWYTYKDGTESAMITADGEGIRECAMRLLRLSEAAAVKLFYSGRNPVRYLEAVIEDIEAGRYSNE